MKRHENTVAKTIMSFVLRKARDRITDIKRRIRSVDAEIAIQRMVKRRSKSPDTSRATKLREEISQLRKSQSQMSIKIRDFENAINESHKRITDLRNVLRKYVRVGVIHERNKPLYLREKQIIGEIQDLKERTGRVHQDNIELGREVREETKFYELRCSELEKKILDEKRRLKQEKIIHILHTS
jgi:hypothetical protein